MWPLTPSWPGTKHGNAVALCMYLESLRGRISEQRSKGKRTCGCLWREEKRFCPCWTLPCVSVHSQCLLTLQSYCRTSVRLREYTCDCEGELWVSFDTWNPNKQLRPARTKPRAINSTDIWASGSVCRLIIQHTTKAYTHWCILTWALWQQSFQFHTQFSYNDIKKKRRNLMWNPVWNDMTCFGPRRSLSEG